MTNDAIKLSTGQKHLLRLIVKDADLEGWAPVSEPVFLVAKASLPPELVEFEHLGKEGRGRVRLTQLGSNIVDAMAWL